MDDEAFSFILHNLKYDIDRCIANYNTRKGEIIYNLPEEPPIKERGGDKYNDDPDYFVNIYNQKDIITWIKKNLHYLMICSRSDNYSYVPLDRQLKNLFDGDFTHYSTDRFKFCIGCKEFVRDYVTEGCEYKTYRCSYVICEECFWNEVNKKKIIDKMMDRETNKYNKLKIKKY